MTSLSSVTLIKSLPAADDSIRRFPNSKCPSSNIQISIKPIFNGFHNKLSNSKGRNNKNSTKTKVSLFPAFFTKGKDVTPEDQQRIDQISGSISLKPSNQFKINSNWVISVGVLAITVAEPALAVTGVNNEEDLIWILLKCGVVAFGYFLIMPPIIMNWLRIRWFKRNLLEMYLQFMCIFIFFPGVLLWAPFLNFRKFPRDPSLKYPWSKPENPSQVKGGFLKYPWATIDDYE